MSYICVKALRISGVAYAPGDVIPDGAVLPERERALKAYGFIGECAGAVSPSVHGEQAAEPGTVEGNTGSRKKAATGGKKSTKGNTEDDAADL